MNIKLRQTIELEITTLNSHGQGQGVFQEKIIDVDNIFPGDKVKASITFISKEKIFAKAFEFIAYSPLRTKPFCPLALSCGGCNWQELSYETQLQFKKELIEKEFHKQELPVTIRDVCPSPSLAYRSKIQLPLVFSKGKTLIGYYKKNSHEVIDMDSCPVHPEMANELVRKIKEVVTQEKISLYDEKKHKGLLRHILIRFSVWEQKSILTLVINSTQIPQAIFKLSTELSQLVKNLGAIQVNFNTQEGNTILGNEDEIIWGDDILEEVINDKHYTFSSKSFFQTNIAIAEKICEKVQSLFKEGTLLDLYSGVGLYAVQLGEKAKTITCIEYSEEATLHALENLKQNDLQNKSQCHSGDVLKYLENYVRDQKVFDTVIVNPPRKGLDGKVRELLPKLVSRDMIYVSCSPLTLARDLKELSAHFEFDEIFPFDMFPHTSHVENVVHLRKK